MPRYTFISMVRRVRTLRPAEWCQDEIPEESQKTLVYHQTTGRKPYAPVRMFESYFRLVHSVAASGCPVSCLDFNGSGTHLAIGYGSGLLRVFNVATGKMVFESSDVVQPGKGILQVIFIGRC